MTLIQELVIEFISTFIIVLIVLKTNGQIIPVTIAFAILSYMAFNISGGFFNPATTTLAYLSNKKGFTQCLLYIVVQMLAVYSGYRYYKTYGVPLRL